MATLRFSPVGSLTDRLANPAVADTTDQRFINCFPEIVTNQITGKSELWLNKRQGGAASADVQASATGQYGSIVWTTNAASTSPAVFSFLKSSATSMMFFNDSATQIGADVASTSGCSFMAETTISGTSNLTATLNNSSTAALEAWYFPEAGSWTHITSSAFPSTITASHAHIDGYMVVMATNGNLHHSDLNSLANWTAGNYIPMSGGGKGLGCVRLGQFIIGFSDYTTELFYNAGNAAGSVLSRVRDGVIRIGAMRSTAINSSPSFRVVGDYVYWIGQTADNAARAVYRMKAGSAPDKISNTFIDRLAADAQITYIAGSFQMFGMTHIAFSAQGVMLCYCPDTKYWWSFTPMTGSPGVFSVNGAAGSNGYSKAYLASSVNAKIYSFSPNSPLYQDDGANYTMTVRTGNQDLNTRKRKAFISVGLIGDVQTTTSPVTVSYSDDDYATFTTSGTIDMSKVPPPLLTRLGSSRRRAWQFQHTTNTPLRLQAVEIEYTVAPN